MKKITDYCTKCGSQLADEADFCHKCGSKIEMVKGVPTAVAPIETKVPSSSGEVYDSSKYDRRRRVVIGLSISIIVIILVPIILWAIFGFVNYTYIGSYNYDEPSMDYSNLNLVINNNVGSVDIIYDSSLTKAFEAEVEVFGRKDASLTDAVNFTTIYLDNDTVEISFESGEFDFFFWDNKVFTYDITAYINPDIITDIFVDTDTGSISLATDGIDLIVFKDIFLTTDTGSLDVDFSNSVNTTLQDFDLETNTGRISVDLGVRTAINDSYVSIDTDTGSIDFEYIDLIAIDDMSWFITTDTGSIDIQIIQNIVYPYDFLADFAIETSTGSINVDFQFNVTIGYQFYGSTSTGSVDILGYEDHYTSPNFATASNVYDFVLSTSTGSVTVDEI